MWPAPVQIPGATYGVPKATRAHSLSTGPGKATENNWLCSTPLLPPPPKKKNPRWDVWFSDRWTLNRSKEVVKQKILEPRQEHLGYVAEWMSGDVGLSPERHPSSWSNTSH